MFDDVKYPEPDPNKKPAAQVWDGRYAKEGYLFGKEPAVTLKTFIGELKKGKAIDVACGEGRNAVFLVQNGFDVEAIDCSTKGIEKTNALAKEKGVNVAAKTQNLDFFLMPLMKYDTVVMTYLHPQARFFSEIKRGLVVGGTAVIEAYTVDHFKNQKSPNPNLDFEECYKPNELLGHLRDFHVMYYKEMDGLVQAVVKKKSA